MSNKQWNSWNSGNGTPSLERAVRNLNPKAKQAMWAATDSGVIARGTWNGCAFNAAGDATGTTGIKSVQRAAEAFDLSESVVQTFIGAWDHSYSQGDANTVLRDTLTKVGLFTEAGVGRGKRVVSRTLHKNQQEALMEAFEAQMEADEVEAVCEATSLMELVSA